VGSVAKLLVDHRISGAPVVDPDGEVVGIVSEGELMRRADCADKRSGWLSLLVDPTT
jgi:CBS domain-containing protein